MSSRHTIARQIRQALEPLYGTREAEQIARRVVCHYGACSLTEYVVHPQAELDIPNLDAIIRQLTDGRPIQYVLGVEEFCGLKFRVAEGVLIPRPETEELVEAVAGDMKPTDSLLDIGTGSGCIAIALKQRFPQAQVTAVDCSSAALQIAQDNAQRLHAEVRFLCDDALSGLQQLTSARFDVIVSNPPYVPQSDCCDLRINVRDYEPHEALFVPNEDPLCFYRAILRFAHRTLHPTGRVWFEIYEHFGEQMQQLCREEQFEVLQLRNDINDKPRMLCCTPRK
jgi:release factor glutamine methyltransferase